MKKVLIVSVLVGLMAGAAFGLPNYKIAVRDAATTLNTVDMPAGGEVTVEIFIDNQGDTSGGSFIGGAQARLLADKPGVSYAAAIAEGTLITNYKSPWVQDATNTASWKGWFAADPADETMPLIDENTGEMTALPGGPLPTPSLGSSRSNSKADNVFATLTLNVAAGSAFPITVFLDPTPGTGTLLFTGAGVEIATSGLIPFVITPEPISALLLLAGLPMLRRRR